VAAPGVGCFTPHDRVHKVADLGVDTIPAIGSSLTEYRAWILDIHAAMKWCVLGPDCRRDLCWPPFELCHIPHGRDGRGFLRPVLDPPTFEHTPPNHTLTTTERTARLPQCAVVPSRPARHAVRRAVMRVNGSGVGRARRLAGQAGPAGETARDASTPPRGQTQGNRPPRPTMPEWPPS